MKARRRWFILTEQGALYGVLPHATTRAATRRLAQRIAKATRLSLHVVHAATLVTARKMLGDIGPLTKNPSWKPGDRFVLVMPYRTHSGLSHRSGDLGTITLAERDRVFAVFDRTPHQFPEVIGLSAIRGLGRKNPSRTRVAKAKRRGVRRAFNRKERRALAQSKRYPRKGQQVMRAHGARRKARTGTEVPTRRRRTKAKKNPSAAVMSAADATFKKWHGFKPRNVQRLRGSRVIPRVLVKLGEVVQFVYRSDKWGGKPVTYEHRTKTPRPQLCTGPDGRGLYIVGGRTRVTARGLMH